MAQEGDRMSMGQEREKIFDNLAWWVHRHGIRPDHISLLQVPVYAAMVYTGYYATTSAMIWTFGWLQVLTVVIDGADGILARRTGTVTRKGHLLDALFDISGIGLTLWVVSIHHAEYSSWLLLLLLVNFLVYIQNEIQGTKSVTYTRGPVTLGFVFAQYNLRFLPVGILLPLCFGTLLLFTRVAWRKRFWTYYEFFTAGRRREYKATPRELRHELGREQRISAPAGKPDATKKNPPTEPRAASVEQGNP